MTLSSKTGKYLLGIANYPQKKQTNKQICYIVMYTTMRDIKIGKVGLEML